MEMRTSTVAVVAASCITIGAAGAFLAGRTSKTATPEATPVADVASGAVEQSEGVIADAPSDAPTTAAPALPVAAPPPVAARANTRIETPRAVPAPANAAPRAPSVPRPTEQTHPAVADSRAIATPPTVTEAKVTQPKPIQPAIAEPVAPPAPPEPRYLDLVVATDSVLGLQMESSVTSEKARVEDEVTARVTRDVRVGDRVAIPAGSVARGEVTVVERGGKLRDRARLGIRFTSVVLADGTRVPVETDTIYREGDSPTGESAAKIGGGAIGGAIIGGIFGGAKGAAIGASAGAGAGTAAVVAGGRNSATLPSGTPVTVRLTKPATVTVEE